MRQILINNQLVDLFRVQKGLLGNYSELQIDVCGIWDRWGVGLTWSSLIRFASGLLTSKGTVTAMTRQLQLSDLSLFTDAPRWHILLRLGAVP